MGGKVANLVLVQDSGKPFEFRVVCEVTLDQRDAQLIQARLTEKTKTSLRQVEDVVTKHIDPDATTTFRELVKLAFKDNSTEME